MTERKPVGKKTRFEVFKRDGFRCQYCGSSPPEVVLEIDHIHPVAKGGTNAIDNLLAACYSCNRGKSDGLLEVAPETIQAKAELMAEKREQLKAFERLQKKIRADQDKQISQLEEVFSRAHPNREFTEKFRSDIRKQFMPRLTFMEILEAMEIAMSRSARGGCSGAIKYFCGVCWGMIRERQK